MNLFQTFFPLALLLVVALFGGWVLPYRLDRGERVSLHRRDDQDAAYDIEAVLARHREALERAREAARQAMRATRQANRNLRSAKRDLQYLRELREKELEQHASAS